jgi:peptidoglycan/xylan/chitin deacetylase (PgdA/CDA1 family)
MMSDPLVSVVIPARDAEATIARTFDCLLEQTDFRWEALVIDDGSVDATPAIIADHAARDSRFVALKSTGKGVSTARNVGLSRASGERILFLDSDDWIDRHFLAKMNAVLDGNPSAVAAYCDFCRVMPDGSETAVYAHPCIEQNPFETFARANATAIHGVLVKKSAVLKAGGFDPDLRTCEDWDLWQRIARTGGSWLHLNERLSYYRMSDHSLTQDVQQMLRDAHIVIARGFSKDARVTDPVPTHRDGAPTACGVGPTTAYAYFALWCAGLDCGRAGTCYLSQEILVDLPNTEASRDVIASNLLDAISIGIRATPARLAERWHQYGAGVTDLIAAIGRAWNDAKAARKVQYRFERMVLDHDDLAAPRGLTLTLGIKVDLRSLHTLRPPDGIDRLYVYLFDGPHILTLLDIGVLGAIDRDFWMNLVTGHLSHLCIEDKVEKPVRREIRIHKLTKHLRRFLRSNPDSHRNRLHALQTMMSRQAASLNCSGTATSGSGGSPPIEPEVARYILWNGAVARRAELAQSERRSHIPVLMYHRIATEGPDGLGRYRLAPDDFQAQMLWLRRNGYHTINSEELAWFIANDHPFVGRPVLITFDDGYEDFAEHAWPILRACDFSAEVFIVTDLVGTTAEWDVSFGPPAPLMSAARIAALAAEGVAFGSHLASHPRSDQLSTRELAEELTRSRAQLTKWLSRPVTSLAAPFGCTGQRLRILAAECGFMTLFNTASGAASLQDDPLDLPRMEIRGDCTLDEFVGAMEARL